MTYNPRALREARENTVIDPKNLWNQRLRSVAGTPYSGPTTPSTASSVSSNKSSVGPQSATSAAEKDNTPHSAARFSSGRPSTGTAKGSKDFFATPMKSLFHRYLLPELDTLDERPELTVILDLDETLVSNRRVDLPAAILRPYVMHVLNALRQMKGLEIVLWTASTEETAAPVVEQLHEGGIVFNEVIYRNAKWFTEPTHTKDLRLLGRDMERVVVFDNAPNCVKLNPANAVLVEDFMGDRSNGDAALINVYYIIESLLKGCNSGKSVKHSLHALLQQSFLCHSVVYALPETWSNLNLRDVAAIRIPPHGKFVRANTPPPNHDILKHWTF